MENFACLSDAVRFKKNTIIFNNAWIIMKRSHGKIWYIRKLAHVSFYYSTSVHHCDQLYVSSTFVETFKIHLKLQFNKPIETFVLLFHHKSAEDEAILLVRACSNCYFAGNISFGWVNLRQFQNICENLHIKHLILDEQLWLNWKKVWFNWTFSSWIQLLKFCSVSRALKQIFWSQDLWALCVQWISVQLFE